MKDLYRGDCESRLVGVGPGREATPEPKRPDSGGEEQQDSEDTPRESRCGRGRRTNWTAGPEHGASIDVPVDASTRRPPATRLAARPPSDRQREATRLV
jgi:hypothetical protein